MSPKNHPVKLTLNQALAAVQEACVQEVVLREKTQKDLDVALDSIHDLSSALEQAYQKLSLIKHLCKTCSAQSFRSAVEEVVKNVP